MQVIWFLLEGNYGEVLSLIEVFEDNNLYQADQKNNYVSIEVMKIHLRNNSIQLNSSFGATK